MASDGVRAGGRASAECKRRQVARLIDETRTGEENGEIVDVGLEFAIGGNYGRKARGEAQGQHGFCEGGKDVSTRCGGRQRESQPQVDEESR